MKRINKGIILIIATILLTGCVKSHTVTTIKNDKSMTFSTDYLMSDKLTQMGANISEAVNKDEVEKMGFKYEEVKENNYSGVKLTKEYKNIDDVSDENGRKVNLGDLFNGKDTSGDKVLFKIEKSFFKNKYTATFTYDSSTGNEYTPDDETDNDEVTTENDTKVDNNVTENDNLNTGDLGDMTALMSLASEMELSYVVNLPCKSLSNNATSKSEDGKTLTWKMVTDGAGEINYSFELVNITNLIIVGGSALLIIIVIVVIIILKKKKSKKEAVPTEGLIHTDFDPSIANKISETDTPVQTVANDVVPEVNNISTEPIAEVPSAQPASLEFALPEEKTIEEVKIVNEVNPVVKEPVFVSPVIEQPDQSQVVQPNTQAIQEIETPDIVDMDSPNNN